MLWKVGLSGINALRLILRPSVSPALLLTITLGVLSSVLQSLIPFAHQRG